MKLLIINFSDKYGGAAIATHRIYSSLKKIIDVYLYVNDKNYKDKKIIARKKFPYFFFQEFEKLLVKIFHYKSKKNHSYGLLPTGCLKVINEINPDIVQLHWVGQNTISIKEIGSIKVPIVWRLSDMWPMLGSDHYDNKINLKKKIDLNFKNIFNIDSYIYHLKKKYFKNNINYIAPSTWMKHKLDTSILTKQNYKEIIPNVIDTAFWKSKKQNKNKIKKKLNIKKEIVITYGSTFVDDPRKGFKYLLDSLNFLDFQYKLIIFGHLNDKNLLHRLKNSSKIKYLGNIDSRKVLRDVYSITDVVVLPSLLDNSPNIIFEANACSSPVVAFKNSGTNDFILHKKTGWLAIDKNSNDLAKGIKWCVSKKNRKILKINSRKFCVKNFSEKNISNAYLKLYKKIISNKNINL